MGYRPERPAPHDAARRGRPPGLRPERPEPRRDPCVRPAQEVPLRAAAPRFALDQHAPARRGLPRRSRPPGAQLGDRSRPARAGDGRRGDRLGGAVPEGRPRRGAHVPAVHPRPGPRPQPPRRGGVAAGGGDALGERQPRAPGRRGAPAAVEGHRRRHHAEAGLVRDHQRSQHQGQVRRVGLDLLRDLPDGDRPDQPVLGDRRLGELHPLLERRGRPAHRSGPGDERPGGAKRAPRPGRGPGGRRRGRRLPART